MRYPGDDGGIVRQAARDFDPAPIVARAEGQFDLLQLSVPHQPDPAAMPVETGDRHLRHHQRTVAVAGGDAHLGLLAEIQRLGAVCAGQPDSAFLIHPVAFKPDAGDTALELSLRLRAQPDRAGLAKRIVEDGLSVRQAEALAQMPPAQQREPRPAAAAQKDADMLALEKLLSDATGMKVSIAHKDRGGELRVAYRTLEQLDELCRRLKLER